MGIETAALIIGGISAAATVGEMAEQSAAAAAEQQALNLQAKQLKLQTQQKTLSNYDTMEKVLDAQVAHMTTTGAAFSSPSFNAIERGTYNTGAKEQRNTKIEGELQQENIEAEKSQVQSKLFADLFGDAGQFAITAAGLYEGMPRGAAKQAAATKFPNLEG